MRAIPFALLGTIALGVAGPPAAGAPLADQSDLDTDFDGEISSRVTAEDFTLAAPRLLTGAAVWLVDDNLGNNGIIDSFGGQLSWAFFEDDKGVPGAFVESGNAVALVETDVGFQRTDDYDIHLVHFRFDHPVSLGAGTFWFALHEGSWLSASDGSETWWLFAATSAGAPRQYAENETAPGSWSDFGYGSGGAAFVLYGEPTAWDQADVQAGADGWPISSRVNATDFTLGTTTTVSAVDVWLGDNTVNDNGVVDSFGGTLGWAIYANGANLPGALLASGQDASPVLVDTGLQDTVGSDIVRARFRLGRALELSAGTYWLAVHEGDWGSVDDASEVYWVYAPSTVGLSSYADFEEQNPVTWDDGPHQDSAFVMFEEAIFGSGFESGTTCAWLPSSSGVCP